MYSYLVLTIPLIPLFFPKFRQLLGIIKHSKNIGYCESYFIALKTISKRYMPFSRRVKIPMEIKRIDNTRYWKTTFNICGRPYSFIINPTFIEEDEEYINEDTEKDISKELYAIKRGYRSIIPLVAITPQALNLSIRKNTNEASFILNKTETIFTSFE